MRKLILLLGVISLAACNNDSTSPNGNVTGTYTLRTVNGNPLPYTFSDGSVLVSDHLSLNSDGSYQDVATFNNGSRNETGFWSINNNLITFNDQTDPGNLSYNGSVSGSVLTETFPDQSQFNASITEVYQKD